MFQECKPRPLLKDSKGSGGGGGLHWALVGPSRRSTHVRALIFFLVVCTCTHTVCGFQVRFCLLWAPRWTGLGIQSAPYSDRQ